MPIWRFQDTEALIFMHAARLKRWLLADHPVAGDLAIFTDRVVNIPVPREQLNRALADVFDSDEVGEDIAVQDRLRLLLQVDWANADANTLRFLIIERLRVHRQIAPDSHDQLIIPERGAHDVSRTRTLAVASIA